MLRRREAFAFLLSPEAPFSALGPQGEALDSTAQLWLHLARSPEFRVAYYNTLIEYLRACVDKKKVLGVSLEHTVATLYFLAFIPYVLELPDPPLPRDCQGIVKACTQLDSDLNQVMNFGLQPATVLLPVLLQDVLTLPALTCTHRDQKFPSLLSGQEVQITSLADLVNPAGPHSYLFALNPLFAETDYAKHTFLFLYICTLLERNPSLRPLVGHTLLTLLRQLPQDDPTFEQKLLPLLFVLETLALRFSTDSLPQLAVEVDSFRRWPLPYSAAANQTFVLLREETQRPGLPFMQRVRTVWPPLSMVEAADTETEHLLAPASSVLARLFAEWTRREFEQYLKVPRVQGRSRTSVIAHLLRVNWLRLQLPRRAARVCQLSDRSCLAVCELLLQGHLAEAEAAIQTAGPGDPALEAAYKASDLPARSCAEFPPLLLSRLDPDALYLGTAPLGDSLRVISQDQRVANIYRALQQLLHPSSFPIRLMICGSDELIHAFLLAYYKLISADNDLYESASLQLYVVPDLGKSDSLSQFVASVDPWYQRHVYVPARRLPWAPAISPPHLEAMRPRTGAPLLPPDLELPPVRMVGHLLRHYLQQANTQLHVPLYEVECLGFKTTFTLPFCMYVEVGVLPAAKREQLNSPESSLESILESRHFHFEPKPLHMKVTPVDLFGVEQPSEEMLNRLVHRLVVSNIPRPSDKATPASPFNDWLELALLDKAGAEEEASLLKRVKSGRQIPQELASLQSSLYSGLHVREVQVNSALPLAEFDLLVDGEVYGPFTSVRVMPMRPLAFDDWPSLRLMTFMESDKV